MKEVFPKELRRVATSLQDELGRKIQLEELFSTLLETIESLYEQFIEEGSDSILEEWKSYARFLGHKVEVTTLTEKVSGLALDIDPRGALALELEDGTVKHVLTGDVSLQLTL